MIINSKEYIAKKIKEYRKKCGLTQAELAEKIDLGTKQVSRIEIAEFYPSLNTFFKIAETLKMDLSDFVTNTSNDNNKIRKKLIDIIYNATQEELCFYDRLITFSQDEIAELKKNLVLKKFQ